MTEPGYEQFIARQCVVRYFDDHEGDEDDEDKVIYCIANIDWSNPVTANAELMAAARELVPQLLERAQKAEQVINSIVNLTNAGKSITFTDDWGGNTLTICIDEAHTHVGAPEGSLDNLIKDLYSLLVEGKGLNWVRRGSQEGGFI